MKYSLPLPINRPKACSCGIVQTVVPEGATYVEEQEMFYWDCPCHSTLTYAPDFEKSMSLFKRKKTDTKSP